ncbi:MAG: glycoside hydrolase family 127 protein [Anaerolineae bacterium]
MAFQMMPLGAVKPQGWFKQQLLDDLQHGFASRLDALTERAATDLFRDRISSSQSQFAWWDSETRGNWLWGYVMMAFLAEDAEHIARVTTLVEALLATQDADGYIGIYSHPWRYHHPPGENGELWAQGRALLTLLAFYELTGRRDVFEAVERAARLTMAHYGAENPYYQRGDDPFNDLTGLTHGLNYVDVVAWLYRLTGDTTYRDFGIWLYDDFCRMPVPFPNDDLAAVNLLRLDHRGFSGHSAHTAEHLRVLLWSAAASGRDDLRAAVQAAIRKLRLYLLPSGALIGDEGIHGMPRPDIGYEYCAMTELLVSLTAGQVLTGESWYGDLIETLAFNAAQGARMDDGTGIAYLSSDTRLAATAALPDSYSYVNTSGAHGRFKFSPTHEDVACCCNPNAVRFLPQYISGMWLRAEDGLVAAVYGASSLETTVNGVPVRIETATGYPFSDEMTMMIQPERPVEFALYLRQPAWVDSLQVDAPAETRDGYVIVRRQWQMNDTLHIRLHNTIRTGHYPTGEVSLHRGALQFVLPIDNQQDPIKAYPVPGFHDYDVHPVSLENAHIAPLLSLDQLVVEQTPVGDHPWRKSPLVLLHGEYRLVPLGCTLLRRAAFTLRK